MEEFKESPDKEKEEESIAPKKRKSLNPFTRYREKQQEKKEFKNKLAAYALRRLGLPQTPPSGKAKSLKGCSSPMVSLSDRFLELSSDEEGELDEMAQKRNETDKKKILDAHKLEEFERQKKEQDAKDADLEKVEFTLKKGSELLIVHYRFGGKDTGFEMKGSAGRKTFLKAFPAYADEVAKIKEDVAAEKQK